MITLQELLPALEEIGPVRRSGVEQTSSDSKKTTETAPSLQQISQGAWVSGVCLGLARYLRVEVTLIRVIAAALLFFTGGAALLLYGVLAGIVPFAEIDPNGPPVAKIPAKLREWIELLRRKIAAFAR